MSKILKTALTSEYNRFREAIDCVAGNVAYILDSAQSECDDIFFGGGVGDLYHFHKKTSEGVIGGHRACTNSRPLQTNRATL